MKKSIAKNYFYNMAYQIIAIIIPIITTPYLSRVLGAENIGIYSYTMSITTYFVLFGSLGINLYGSREIAYYEDDKHKYSCIFWEIFFLKAFTMIISLIFFLLFFVIRNNDYRIYYVILAFELVASLIDISWFFQGIEEFKKTATRNMLIKIISILCIFLLVKSKNDFIIYFIIYVLSALLGNLTLWMFVPKYLDKPNLNFSRIKKHIVPMFTLFIPQVALQVSTVLDKTMLGVFFDNKIEVGFYEQAQKIVRILLMVVTSLGLVIMPRIANRYAKKDIKEVEKYIEKSINATILISFPLIFGISVVSNNFVPVFFGNGYDRVIILLMFLSPILLFMGLSENLGKQYLLPTKQQKKFTISVFIGFIFNIIINILLIPKFGAIGASCATVIAEFIVIFIQIFMVSKEIKINYIFKYIIKYFFFSFLMFVFCYMINFLNLSNLLALFFKIFIGGFIYILFLLLSKDKFIFNILDKYIGVKYESK